MKLAGKVAIVTGAAWGIGEAIAIGFAKEGAGVVASDIKLDLVQDVANRIKSLGHQALAVQADVTRSDQVRKMVEATLQKFDKVDILVNVAGGTKKTYLFQDSNEEDWDFIINVNLKGTLICTRAVLDCMIQRKGGKIINISSVAGIGGVRGLVDYSAAKAGVIGFTMALAKEVGQYNINVNAIAPGPTETPGLDELKLSSEWLEELKKRTSLGRLGKPDDIANMAVFLASEDANFITGQNYAVCGTRSLPV
jgi:NAD(P)-dependent dehydrogenase (short-subunit alcohol dehydrogenase family)